MQNKKNLFFFYAGFFYAECKVFNFHSGVTYALQFVHAQFLELMDEWYGHNGPYDDERMEMTRLFEERIGADELAPKEIGCGYCILEAVCEQRKNRTIPTRDLARDCGNFVHYATLTNENNNI